MSVDSTDCSESDVDNQTRTTHMPGRPCGLKHHHPHVCGSSCPCSDDYPSLLRRGHTHTTVLLYNIAALLVVIFPQAIAGLHSASASLSIGISPRNLQNFCNLDLNITVEIQYIQINSNNLHATQRHSLNFDNNRVGH